MSILNYNVNKERGINMFGAIDIAGFCTNAGAVLQFVGYALTIVKVAIPIIIIIYGIMDFGKAVVASKDEEIKTSAKRLLWRAVAGVIIFFIPSIVLWLFDTISQYTAGKGGFDNCQKCILTPWNCVTGSSQY